MVINTTTVLLQGLKKQKHFTELEILKCVWNYKLQLLSSLAGASNTTKNRNSDLALNASASSYPINNSLCNVKNVFENTTLLKVQNISLFCPIFNLFINTFYTIKMKAYIINKIVTLHYHGC